MLNLLASEDLNVTPLIICCCALAIGIPLLAVFLDTDKRKLDTKCLAFAGISVGLSIALSLVKLFALPQGGSVTLASLLPILLFSYIYGTKKGLFVGIIVGFLNCAIEPYVVHPAQLFLDYPIAFGAIGLVGVFGKIKALHKIPILEFVLGSIVAGTLRFISHVLSGVFAFSAFATNDVWIYSLVYNSFVFVDIAIAIALGILILSSKPILEMILARKKEPTKYVDSVDSVTQNSDMPADNKETADSHNNEQLKD